MRDSVSIRGLLFAAVIALAATIGYFLIPNRDMGWLSLFAASLTLFFGSLPRDERVRTGEPE